MNSKLLGVMTGAALLASIGVANAGQRAPLTDAQLDRVVAGDAQIIAEAVEAQTLNGTATLSSNAPGAGHTATANVAATFTPVGTTTHFALLVATVN